jgi:hypothetical protein
VQIGQVGETEVQQFIVVERMHNPLDNAFFAVGAANRQYKGRLRARLLQRGVYLLARLDQQVVERALLEFIVGVAQHARRGVCCSIDVQAIGQQQHARHEGQVEQRRHNQLMPLLLRGGFIAHAVSFARYCVKS